VVLLESYSGDTSVVTKALAGLHNIKCSGAQDPAEVKGAGGCVAITTLVL